MKRRDKRRIEIAALRKEGAEAFAAGRSRSALPIKYACSMDREHWWAGWNEAHEEAKRREAEEGAE